MARFRDSTNPDEHPSKQAADAERMRRYQAELDTDWERALHNPVGLQEVVDRAFDEIVGDEALLCATLRVTWEHLAPLYGMEGS